MPLHFALLIFVGGSVSIAKSADLVVKTAVRLAHRFHISEFNMGFFILGLATTTPELFIGIQSVIDHEPQLSLGNLIGASIVLLTLIIGLNAVVSGEVQFIKSFSKKDMLLTSFVIIAPVFLLIDGVLSRYDGVMLVVLYVLFYLVMNKEQTFAEHIKYSLSAPHNHIIKSFFILFLGIAGLFISSKFMVDSVEIIANAYSLPLVIVGLLMLSIGTNLPELTVLFTTIKNGHKEVGVGDFLGSAVANTPVLGFVALLSPIQLDAPLKVFLSLGMLFLTLLTFNAYFSIDKKITRLEGISLVALYAFFIFSEVYIKNQF